jgi:hypothetical protein
MPLRTLRPPLTDVTLITSDRARQRALLAGVWPDLHTALTAATADPSRLRGYDSAAVTEMLLWLDLATVLRAALTDGRNLVAKAVRAMVGHRLAEHINPQAHETTTALLTGDPAEAADRLTGHAQVCPVTVHDWLAGLAPAVRVPAARAIVHADVTPGTAAAALAAGDHDAGVDTAEIKDTNRQRRREEILTVAVVLTLGPVPAWLGALLLDSGVGAHRVWRDSQQPRPITADTARLFLTTSRDEYPQWAVRSTALDDDTITEAFTTGDDVLRWRLLDGVQDQGLLERLLHDWEFRGNRGIGNAHDILLRFPHLPFICRLKLMRSLTGDEVVDTVLGDYTHALGWAPGQVTAVLDDIAGGVCLRDVQRWIPADHAPGTYPVSTTLRVIVDRMLASAASFDKRTGDPRAAQELTDYLIRTAQGLTERALQSPDTVLGQAVLQYLHDRLGTDAAAWEVVAQLHDQFPGTVHDLTDAAALTTL